MKAINDHAAKRLKEQEEEDAVEEANAISIAKSDEVAKLHMQLKREQGYLTSMVDAVGQEAEERKAVLEKNIRWYQHRITDMKEPSAKTKALQHKFVALFAANSATLNSEPGYFYAFPRFTLWLSFT